MAPIQPCIFGLKRRVEMVGIPKNHWKTLVCAVHASPHSASEIAEWKQTLWPTPNNVFLIECQHVVIAGFESVAVEFSAVFCADDTVFRTKTTIADLQIDVANQIRKCKLQAAFSGEQIFRSDTSD